jgi:hypothetical protein
MNQPGKIKNLFKTVVGWLDQSGFSEGDALD